MSESGFTELKDYRITSESGFTELRDYRMTSESGFIELKDYRMNASSTEMNAINSANSKILKVLIQIVE